jgi:hypothetical protein
MTVYEIYDQTIKTLPVDERLRLAKLILNDLSPDEETLGQNFAERPGEIRDQDHLEELLLAGLNSGPGIEVTPEYWENKRTVLLERRAQRTQKA